MTLRLLSLADVKVPPACIYYAVSCVWMRRWQGPTPERIAVAIEVKSLERGNIDISARTARQSYGVVSLCASAAGWVQMRCRECAAEVAVTARVCSGCGAPIVGQPPVVADAVVVDTVVADTVVGAISDAAGKAVPARVAGHAPPEPYVPGSRDRVPAELRRVLGEYAGIGFAGALACAASAAISILFDASDDPTDGLLFFFLFVGAWLGGLSGASKALKARIRFSRLLRRPSDPRTATVTASKRGGRTLILDIIPRDSTGRGYQSLSEVRLDLWMKAGMLVPGETVNVYGGPAARADC
jgi:hypothetical protein